MTVRSEWLGDQVKNQVRAAAARGLLQGADDVIEASRAVAPRETGELRQSAYTGVDESSLIAIAGYDVPRDIKTIKQHEDLTYRHPSGEQAKFLEKPLRSFGTGGLTRAVADEVRRVLGG